MPALGGLFSFKIPPPGGISYYSTVKPRTEFKKSLCPGFLNGFPYLAPIPFF